MKRSWIWLLPLLIASCLNRKEAASPAPEGYRLVWSDEFNGTGLPDTTKWSYDTGGHGWGNNELEYYSANRLQNARVENGNLIIEAHKEELNDMHYTSARMVTKGKGDWKYGRVEVKAKLPRGRGTWPAIWMLPSENIYGGWPKSGEIDIMEHVGFDPGNVHGTVHTEAYNHTKGTQKAGTRMVPDAMDAFHVYAVEWSAEKMDFFIDEELYFTFRKEDQGAPVWPFDQPFHLILNIAVGGNWGGQKGIDDSIWPQRMEVDYVRVFQKN